MMKWAFCAAVLALALFQFSENTADPDLWDHVMVGERIILTRHLPAFEPYSWTARGTPWINHEWLAEVALGGAHLLGGGTGILLLKIVVGFCVFGIALRLGTEDLEWPRKAVAWAVAALAVVEISFGFAARPQIFTAFGLTIELWVLRRMARGKWAWAAVLPFVFVLWVNAHGGVLAGVAVLFVATIAMTIQRAASTPGLIWAWAAAILCPFALLVNPYGFELIRWTVSGVIWLHQRPELEEWHPTDLGWNHAGFFILVILAIAAFALSRQRAALWEMAVCAGLALFGWRSMRNTPLFAIAALAFVPPHLADVLERFQNSYARLAELSRSLQFRQGLSAVLVAAAVGIFVATFALHKQHPLTMEVPKNQYPVAAVEFMRRHNMRGNLLDFFDWGEMCLWELPQCAPSLDGRWETCYPRDLIPEHWKFYNGEPVDKHILDFDKADFALLPANLAGAGVLAKNYHWTAVYFDDLAVVLVRNPKAFPQLATQTTAIQGPADATVGRDAFPNARCPRL